MSKVKTAVLVSGGGTNLQALIDAEQAGRLPHVEFVSVISSRLDAYALTRAQKAGIPAHTAIRKGQTQEAFEREILRLGAKIAQDGLTLVPTEIYLKDSLVKVQIGLARGKKLYDKRDSAAKRDMERAIQRGVREANS